MQLEQARRERKQFWQQPRRQRQQQAGFTLVELLVVISIIALLISILLPSLRSAREQAKLVKCMAHQRGIAQAGMAFATDHNGRMHLVTNSDGVNEADPSRSKYAYDSAGELMVWPAALAQASGMDISANWEWGVRADNAAQALERKDLMSGQFEQYICPADRVQISSTFWPMGTGSGMLTGSGNPKTNVDDSISGGTQYWGRLSYGINEDLVGATTRPGQPPPVGRWVQIGTTWLWARGEVHPQAGKRFAGQLDRLFDPATVLLITDAGANSEQQLLNAITDDPSNEASLANLITSAKMPIVPALGQDHQLGQFMHTFFNRVPYNRHPKGAVGVVFADFHAETVRPTEWREKILPGGIKRDLPWKYSGNVRISPFPGGIGTR
jgi:prepilin-type N-terminal cleavage/methylation domain-containing protein